MWSTVQNYVFDVEIAMNSQENQFTKNVTVYVKIKYKIGTIPNGFYFLFLKDWLQPLMCLKVNY